MTLSDVINKVKVALMGTADYFERTQADESISLYKLMVQSGLAKLRTINPLTMSGTILLAPGVAKYDGPDDLWTIKSHTWGANQQSPWECGFVGNIPTITVSNGSLLFSVAPTGAMLNSLGRQFQYFYLANYSLTEDAAQNNVPEELEPILLLLCQAAAMEMLMVRGASNPVSVKAGVGRISRAAPADVYDLLMKSAKEMALHS